VITSDHVFVMSDITRLVLVRERPWL